MTEGRCSRSWEIEAVRDGRLNAAAGASHTVHLETCAVCRREAAALEALIARLQGANTPADAVSVRRVRRQVLERADGAVRERGPAGAGPWAVLCGVLVVVACVVAVALRRGEHGVIPRESVAVKPSPGAVFLRSRASAGERIELRDGTLSLDVAAKPGEPRLRVGVPDGEIEDVGTVFSVTVSGDRTTDIRVTTGMVVFHRNDGAHVEVRPGAPYAPAASPPPVQPDEAVRSGVPAGEPRPAATAGTPPQRPHDPPPRTSATVDPAPAASALEDEDVAYLEVVTQLRAGKRHEAVRAARDYLSRYPRGFRRQEVQRVLDGR